MRLDSIWMQLGFGISVIIAGLWITVSSLVRMVQPPVRRLPPVAAAPPEPFAAPASLQPETAPPLHDSLGTPLLDAPAVLPPPTVGRGAASPAEVVPIVAEPRPENPPAPSPELPPLDDLFQPPRQPEIIPRRVPVEGVDGTYLLVYPDGSTKLLYPDGHTELVSGPARTERSLDDVEKRITAKRQRVQNAVKVDPRRLVMLGERVISLTPGDVITFQDEKRLVVISATGTSRTYLADGRTMQRIRVDPAAKQQAEGSSALEP